MNMIMPTSITMCGGGLWTSVQERREASRSSMNRRFALAVRYLQEAPSCTDFAALTGNRPFV